MIGIAGVLLLIVLVFSVAVVASNPDVLIMSVFGAQVPVTLGGVYFTGAGAMLVLILAAGLLRTGWRRRRVQQRQLQALQEAAGSSSPTSGAATPSTPTPSTRTSEASGPPARSANQDSTVPQHADPEPTPGRAGSTAVSPERLAAASTTGSSSPETTEAERQALLDEAEELTGERDDR